MDTVAIQNHTEQLRIDLIQIIKIAYSEQPAEKELLEQEKANEF